MNNISFPALPKLLLSATDLVSLDFWAIGYVSPEAMATCLAVLNKLEFLQLAFRISLPSRHRRPSPRPPLPRAVLPALISFFFRGFSEYVEDLVAQIESPLLSMVEITVFHQLVLVTPQLPQFISRAERFKALDRADFVFCGHLVEATFSSQTETDTVDNLLRISCI